MLRRLVLATPRGRRRRREQIRLRARRQPLLRLRLDRIRPRIQKHLHRLTQTVTLILPSVHKQLGENPVSNVSEILDNMTTPFYFVEAALNANQSMELCRFEHPSKTYQPLDVCLGLEYIYHILPNRLLCYDLLLLYRQFSLLPQLERHKIMSHYSGHVQPGSAPQARVRCKHPLTKLQSLTTSLFVLSGSILRYKSGSCRPPRVLLPPG